MASNLHHHWIELSRSALLHNLRSFRQTIGPAPKLMAMVKANAYGHGLSQIVPLISPLVDYLAVNTLAEGLAARKLTPLPILIAAPIPPSHLAQASRHHLSLCVPSLEYLNQLSSFSPPLSLHLKVNTGTNRLGLAPSQLPHALSLIQSFPQFNLEGLYTHFHSSDSGSPATDTQFRLFSDCVTLTKSVFPHCLAHAGSSSVGFTRSHMHLDMVRLGISLYGYWPDPYIRSHSSSTLHPVLSWLCHPLQTRTISAGESVSYSATYTYSSPGQMAVLPIGYSDGYDRGLSNLGQVWSNSHLYPVIGRVAMNFTLIDTTSRPLSLHDTVELLGPHRPADEVAAQLNTISYEVLARLSPLIPRLVSP